MKKASLFTILFLLTNLANGQVNKLSIGIVGSPDYYNYQFRSTPGFKHHFKPKINYNLGLSMNYYFTEKKSLKTGLFFSSKGYIIEYSWGNIAPNDPAIPLKSNIKISYIDFPVLVSYDFLKKKKLSLFASTGIVASFLMKEKEISKFGDGSEKETEYSKTMFNQMFNKTLFALNLELGLKYNLSEKSFISIAPYFRYGLKKTSNELLKSNPISFGTGLGLHFKL